MKQVKPQTDFAKLENVSFTITQLNQNSSGKQTVNRTYWSIRKKVKQSDENSSNLMLKDSEMTEEGTRRDRRNKQKPVERFIQLSLFPPSIQ